MTDKAFLPSGLFRTESARQGEPIKTLCPGQHGESWYNYGMTGEVYPVTLTAQKWGVEGMDGYAWVWTGSCQKCGLQFLEMTCTDGTPVPAHFADQIRQALEMTG